MAGSIRRFTEFKLPARRALVSRTPGRGAFHQQFIFVRWAAGRWSAAILFSPNTRPAERSILRSGKTCPPPHGFTGPRCIARPPNRARGESSRGSVSFKLSFARTYSPPRSRCPEVRALWQVELRLRPNERQPGKPGSIGMKCRYLQQSPASASRVDRAGGDHCGRHEHQDDCCHGGPHHCVECPHAQKRFSASKGSGSLLTGLVRCTPLELQQIGNEGRPPRV
jgi:hypothetical protein